MKDTVNPRKKRLQTTMMYGATVMALSAIYVATNLQQTADFLFNGDLELTKIFAGVLAVGSVFEFIVAKKVFNPRKDRL